MWTCRFTKINIMPFVWPLETPIVFRWFVVLPRCPSQWRHSSGGSCDMNKVKQRCFLSLNMTEAQLYQMFLCHYLPFSKRLSRHRQESTKTTRWLTATQPCQIFNTFWESINLNLLSSPPVHTCSHKRGTTKYQNNHIYAHKNDTFLSVLSIEYIFKCTTTF